MQSAPPVVLVVEDDLSIAEVLQATLETSGYTVECASDGAAGLARIEAGGVDLVLLDLLLPELDGLELCRRVRARDSEVYLPIIMLTALRGEEQRHAGFTAGADDYVSKPFNSQDVLDRVAVWIQTRQRLKAAHEQLLREHERRRELEQRQLREQLAQNEAVLLMAYTPLKVLTNMLRLWEVEQASSQNAAHVRAELQEAASSLAVEIERLGQILRA